MSHKALGIMTGTSCDGIDIALIITDGENAIKRLQYVEEPFDKKLSQKLKQAGQQAQKTGIVDMNSSELKSLSQEYTQVIIDCIMKHFSFQDIDLIGFHGQTILHSPQTGKTYQLGLPQLMADMTQTKVVFNFRQNDMVNGGQGAPLAPLYHVACVHNLPEPCVFINIGGIANVTYCGNPVMGFDVGTGNCISDDLTQKFFNQPYDEDGHFASLGTVHFDIANQMAHAPIFLKEPPKSFDRNEFDCTLLDSLSSYDAIATANYLSAYCIIQADRFYPQKPLMRIIAGGGSYNKTMIKHLEALSDIPVKLASDIHLNGHAIEAECFAWLAVRSKKRLPLSLPSITGVAEPVSGGDIYYPNLDNHQSRYF